MGFVNRHDNAAALPTVAVVQGAFAYSTSWADVVLGPIKEGLPVSAVASPLRDLAGDADSGHDLPAARSRIALQAITMVTSLGVERP